MEACYLRREALPPIMLETGSGLPCTIDHHVEACDGTSSVHQAWHIDIEYITELFPQAKKPGLKARGLVHAIINSSSSDPTRSDLSLRIESLQRLVLGQSGLPNRMAPIT